MQLVSDKIRLFDPMKGRVIGEKEVIEKFGVKPIARKVKISDIKKDIILAIIATNK